MRSTCRCPKCDCKQLYCIEEVRQPDHRYVNSLVSLTPTAAWLPTGKRGLLGDEEARIEAGTFEAWICSRCGYTEWYAKDASQALAYFARFPGARVRFVDGGGESPPYR